MSEELIVDPDLAPAAPDEPAAPANPPADPAQPQPVAEDDDVPEGTVVPIGALRAVRDEVKALKPLAAKAQQLEAELAEARPYLEFFRQNPHLLQPAAPQPPPQPTEDPALVDYARTLDLYTQDGQPDIKRAQKLRDMTRAEAQAIAQQTIAPVQEATHEQRAAQNIQRIMETAKVGGRPLDQQYLKSAIQTITASVPKSEAVRILADPNVAGVVMRVAQGLQAESMGQATAPVTPPQGQPLFRESPGGGDPLVLNESSKRLAKIAGIPEKDFAERARKYVPGKSNVLE